MSSVNRKAPATIVYTHEGAKAARISNLQLLRRSVMCCLLWEDNAYEDGKSIQERIFELATNLPFQDVAELAIEARDKMKLRHVPLMLACGLLTRREGRQMGDLIEKIIQRPDELTELLALYWREGKRPLAAQLKRGLGRAFGKFNEYQLAKHDSGKDKITMRDVLFLSHAKPRDEAQAALWKRLIDGKMASPETWEVKLSRGEDKKATFTQLMADNKLGALAFLRNMRNMIEAGVDEGLMRSYLVTMNTERVLPFRFISAAKYAPRLEDGLEVAMLKCCAEVQRLLGKTMILIDNSGSMYGAPVSAKSELQRTDAACAMAMLLREVCEQVAVMSFSDRAADVPPRRGFALREAIQRATPHSSTQTGDCIRLANQRGYDRIIVITDEQSRQAIPAPLKGSKAYFINVANMRNGIGYGAWNHIDGWSEAIIDYITALEGEL